MIWRFLLRAAPRVRRDRVDVAGRRAFACLVGYVRATALVAVVDAVGIGLGLALVGVPLVVPLARLLLGRAVRLHALAVVLAVAAGVVVAGITGALLAVPLLAVLNTAVKSLTADADRSPTR